MRYKIPLNFIFLILCFLDNYHYSPIMPSFITIFNLTTDTFTVIMNKTEEIKTIGGKAKECPYLSLIL